MKFRSYRRYNKDTFVHELQEIDWNVGKNNHDINLAVDSWNKRKEKSSR